MTDDMSHPEQIVHLAQAASEVEARPADAAVLLVEAAALQALHCGLPLEDLIARLRESHQTLSAALDVVNALPLKAALRQQ